MHTGCKHTVHEKKKERKERCLRETKNKLPTEKHRGLEETKWACSIGEECAQLSGKNWTSIDMETGQAKKHSPVKLHVGKYIETLKHRHCWTWQCP